jgi:hypothetical protein
VSLTQRALGRLADRGEGLGEELVEGLPGLEPLLEPVGPGPELRVGQRLDLGFVRVDNFDERLEPLQAAALAEVRDLVEDHGSS